MNTSPTKSLFHDALLLLLLAPFLAITSGCVSQPEDAVIVYSAADREYAKPILAAFERRNEGTEVVPQFDVESTKTVGLTARIESEASRPRCDVFWNNEIMHTLRLEKAGLLQPISWDIPDDWPSNYRSKNGNWIGFAARARVLLVNRELLPDKNSWPSKVSDLANPTWKNNCAIARPLFGTTATHFAVLRSQLDASASDELFNNISSNAVVLSGNKQVAQAVSSGRVAFGLTDTDDALIEIDAGLPVEIVFPDQDNDGALRIPNTLAVLAGAPHPVAAKALANYLANQDTEGRLAMGPSGQFPIRPNHPTKSRALKQSVKWLNADFEAAAELWPELSEQLEKIFP